MAVLINRAMIKSRRIHRTSAGESGRSSGALLGGDVRHLRRWMRDEAERYLGHLYPKSAVTDEMVQELADLEPYTGRETTVDHVAAGHARTVIDCALLPYGVHFMSIHLPERRKSQPFADDWWRLRRAEG